MTYERARSIGEVINGDRDNIRDTNLRIIGTTAAALAETVVTWVSIEPTPSLWWLKSIAVLVLNAPLGSLAIYQLTRGLPRENMGDIEKQKKLQRIGADFDRLGLL